MIASHDGGEVLSPHLQPPVRATRTPWPGGTHSPRPLSAFLSTKASKARRVSKGVLRKVEGPSCLIGRLFAIAHIFYFALWRPNQLMIIFIVSTSSFSIPGRLSNAFVILGDGIKFSIFFLQIEPGFYALSFFQTDHFDFRLIYIGIFWTRFPPVPMLN